MSEKNKILALLLILNLIQKYFRSFPFRKLKEERTDKKEKGGSIDLTEAKGRENQDLCKKFKFWLPKTAFTHFNYFYSIICHVLNNYYWSRHCINYRNLHDYLDILFSQRISENFREKTIVVKHKGEQRRYLTVSGLRL